MTVAAVNPHVIRYESDILAQAHAQAVEQKLPYAGGIHPKDAWQLLVSGEAILVDVRSAEERHFVGQIPRGVHIPWATGISLLKNSRFLGELATKVKKDQVLLFLCRSGKRSALAAETATKAGYKHVFNVLEGFEGDLNEKDQRGQHNGWRYHQLPWIQD